MDRALKERIIGAIVLVALVVLVVPVFLDGPPDTGEMISERVPLPGQSEQETQTVVLDRDRSEPVPQTATESPQQLAAKDPEPEPAPEPEPEQNTVEPTAPQAQPAVNDPVQETPVKSVPAKPAPAAGNTANTSATGMFAVQLGSFSSQENAERLAADLRKQGFAAFLSQLTTSDGQLHRVRVGPQKDREAAEKMAARLEKAGHSGKVLPHP